LVFSILACTIGQQSPSDIETATAAALTVESDLLTQAGPGDTPTPGPTSTPTLSPTPSVPTAIVSSLTNCRSGPAIYYDFLGDATPGDVMEIVGRAPTGFPYVVVVNPDAPGNCWLWLEYATISGDISGLPVFPVPPTPTPAATNTPTRTPTPTLTPTQPAPQAPTGFGGGKTCFPHFHAGFPSPDIHDHLEIVSMSWNDNSNNETGFRIYRDGSLIATLAANTTNTLDNPPDPSNLSEPDYLYEVEAYNAAGASARDSFSIGC
jgi:hypothetical protein